MSIGIFYGSCGGTTKIIADALAQAFDVEEVIDVEEDYDDMEQLLAYDVLFLGSSTWGQGDVQHGWVDILLEIQSDKVDFSGKKIAFFGAGDSKKHGEHFVSALGKMYKIFSSAGGQIVGYMPTDGYDFEASLAVVDGKFCGLAIDNHNEKEKTDERIKNWIQILKMEV